MHAKPIKFFKKDDTSTYKLIKDKVINHSEIVVNFFDYCNMRCAFCSQDHESKEGMSRLEILEKIPYILNYINTNNSNLFLLHLMGGELFQDELIDNNFLEYFSEFIETLEKQKPTGVELNYNFITNLVFTRTDKVIEFLNKHNLKIAISYDPVARFTPKQLVQFKTNVDIFKPYIRMVSSVMTKQNMNAIISEDNYFKYLYDNFTIHFER
jgi:sulfatase maturation enzyme AslB (radical SAM superfamily)